jgi:hypothetical protein
MRWGGEMKNVMDALNEILSSTGELSTDTVAGTQRILAEE